MLTLLSLLAVGMLALSSIQLRASTLGNDQAVARANARLALQQAIAQLQVELGPDQRVSAAATLTGSGADSHWTGVWSTTRPDGTSWWRRDPETGSWVDDRGEAGWDASAEARAWLVSGDGFPGDGSAGRVELVGSGSVGDAPDARVSAPLVGLNGDHPGALAWWTGDLGLRADISVHDPHLAATDPTAEYSRIMAQNAAPELIGEGVEIPPAIRERLVSGGSAALTTDRPWALTHFHDFTVHSQAVQANVRDGGLKFDLSDWLESKGTIAPETGLPGVDDETPIFADTDAGGMQPAGPAMGLLRDWAQSAAPYSGQKVPSVTPETDPDGDPDSEAYALANETPARLDGTTRSNLQPILVEASNFMQISTFRTRDEKAAYQLRHHLYPRVVLWNPYNVDLEFDPAIVMIQGNGRQEMWTRDTAGRRLAWLSFEGGRSTDFIDGSLSSILASDAYDDPYMGSYYFSIPKTTFGPGECLVFTPARSAEYDALSAYRLGSYDLSANQLSCDVAPDPSRSFYVSGSDIGGGIAYRPTEFWYAPTPFWWVGLFSGITNQADDTRVVMKQLVDDYPVSYERFDALPQLAYLSGSLQYGAGKEPRIAWNDRSPMDIELLDIDNPRPTVAPDVRTRQGVRLRWFEEHPSNLRNAGPMSGNEAFFQEALFATWNPRATYAVRSPWENLAGSMPTRGSSGSGGGPWFFGAYTRDLFDEAVGWSVQQPRFQEGRYHGNPFGPPQEGLDRHVLFELPRQETGIVSLGQLQSAKFSELVWHPSFPFGNSLPDPRLGTEGLDRTVPPFDSPDEQRYGGFHPQAIGWSSDSDRGSGRDAWAEQARALLQGLPDERLLVYDLSYEINQALWDRYFVSSGTAAEKAAFLADPGDQPLPNGRMMLAGAPPADPAELDFHRAARHLMVDGAFNVNSTRVEAWKAVLAATRDGESTVIRRVLDASEGFDASGDGLDDEAWSGFRTLDDEEIERLAEAIVEEVRRRGPFLSLADFVNRRLRNDETGRRGALQAAIDAAGLNRAFEEALPIDNDDPLSDYRHPDNISDPTRLEQTLKPETLAWGAPGFLTQGDLLQLIGPSINVRSDSFVVRAYGDARDPDGKVIARAWCEAVVQRTPEPVEPGPDRINPRPTTPGRTDFGRRFEIVGFRWLKPEEV